MHVIYMMQEKQTKNKNAVYHLTKTKLRQCRVALVT